MIRYPVLNVLGIDVREPSPPKPVLPVPGPPTRDELDYWIYEWTRLCRNGHKADSSVMEDVEGMVRVAASNLGYDVSFNYEHCLPSIIERSPFPISEFNWSKRATPISVEAQRQTTPYQRPGIPTLPFGGLFPGTGGMTYTGSAM